MGTPRTATADRFGAPDAEVNRLISCLFQNPTMAERNRIAAKLDDQAKTIAALQAQLAEAGFAWSPR